MIVLAIDTATTDLVVGVSGGEGVLAESAIATRSHNELLVPTVTEALESAGLRFSDIEAIVVGCGPGPFTGLRVGMATASAFGHALGVPVHGVCTHDAVAKLIDADSAAVVTDARRREVYWARYENGERTDGPGVIAPAELEMGPVDVLSVPESLTGQLNIETAEVTYVPPRAAGLVAAANLDEEPGPLVPLYLRRPDAKEPAAKPASPAIPAVDLSEL